MEQQYEYESGFRHQPYWLLAFALVVIGQAGLACRLFDSAYPSASIRDDRPILDGRHPLHLYHASLSAGTFRESFAVTCYDPDFQAGYPKTPVFDGGSRPGELFLLAFGKPTSQAAVYDPAAYKKGVWLLCCLVPFCFAASARGFGLTPLGATLTSVLACMVWWSPLVRATLQAGHLDVLCSGLALVVFLGGLVRYGRSPGPTAWLTMAVAALVGWFVQPVVWVGLAPVVAAFYWIHAPRQGLGWHLGFFGVFFAGFGPNLWWLTDWLRFWWVRQPSGEEASSLPQWSALLGSPVEYMGWIDRDPTTWIIVIGAIAGLLLMLVKREVTSVVTLVIAGLAAMFVARLGMSWSPARSIGAERAILLIPALAILPTTYVLTKLFQPYMLTRIVMVACACWPAVCGWWPKPLQQLPSVVRMEVSPFMLGFPPQLEPLLMTIRERTSPSARILIEESDPTQPLWNWTALLPSVTQRAYLGGLDPEASVEHLSCGMKQGRLMGKRFEDWKPEERTSFNARYNVGWVLCRTRESVEWWSSDPTAREIARFHSGQWVLFELERQHSFVRSGKATITQADSHRIVLTDLVPDEQGYVRLSFHYQRELHAAPLVVGVEADPDPLDSVPFLKLKLPGPASRITLTWEHP